MSRSLAVAAGVALAVWALNELTRRRIGRRSKTTEPEERDPFAQLFESLSEEITDAQTLPVSGSIPAWVSGALIRNGPALFDFGEERVSHWFDGQAMLHRFAINNGQVTYINRLLETKNLRAHRSANAIAVSEFGSDPCYTLFGRLASLFVPSSTNDYQNANVNIARMAGRFFALTEVPLPMEFDGETLASLGQQEFDGDNESGQLSSAHPHETLDGQTINYITRIGPKPEYLIYSVPTHTSGPITRTTFARVPTQSPSYMHSFGMTEKYVVLAEFPLRFKLSAMLRDRTRRLVTGRKNSPLGMFEWIEDLNIQFVVVDRATGAIVGTYDGTEQGFCYHHINAFELADGRIALDMTMYERVGYDELTMEQLKSASKLDESTATGQIKRYIIDLTSGAVTVQTLVDTTVELPRINENFKYQEHRYVYGVPGLKHAALIKADVKTGQVVSWTDPTCSPGEPVFVPRPGATKEDDGVVLSVVLDAPRRTSFLLALDGESFTEIARAEVPHHIPAGLHGAFYASSL